MTNERQHQRHKPRAVVFGGGIGMFPPLMERFREEFEIVSMPLAYMPLAYQWLLRLVSVRWPRTAWYRRWRYYVEKTPFAFRTVTKASGRLLAPIDGQYDVILYLGAMHHPGVPITKPLFLFTDSCRWLSSHNQWDDISHFRSPEEEATWLALEGEVYRSAARIFVGSHFVRDAIIDHYGIDPKHVIASGFGAGRIFAEPYEKVFDGRTILYIGKGDFEKKGGHVLLSAFELVRRQRPDTVLHVVGQDRLPEVRNMINHGFVKDRETIVSLMRQAHVYTLPSLVDRNPITVLEAMASGTPCVTSDYGAMPEILGDAGRIAPCNDPEALARELITILDDPGLSKSLGENGRRRYQQLYNWDAVWRTVQSEMQAVLSQRAEQPETETIA
jgi:glycosyltransferase involved in cell wall biosynthesis